MMTTNVDAETAAIETVMDFAVSYLRVSSKSQLDTAKEINPDGNSIATQRESIESREHLLASIQKQLGRLERMDEQLYDDKLAGEITKERYDVKHEEFTLQIKELEKQQANVDVLAGKRLEQRLVLLELSQKAASIYQTRTPEQKRLIITKLFTNITVNQGALSVTYTNFSQIIAQNVLKTKEILGV